MYRTLAFAARHSQASPGAGITVPTPGPCKISGSVRCAVSSSVLKRPDSLGSDDVDGAGASASDDPCDRTYGKRYA